MSGVIANSGPIDDTFSTWTHSCDVIAELPARKVATRTVCSPPQPTPACRGWSDSYCRKRASPQPAGEGLGVGVADWRTNVPTRTTPLPSPPPTQVGLARLAHHKARPGQARGARGREQTAVAARSAWL